MATTGRPESVREAWAAQPGTMESGQVAFVNRRIRGVPNMFKPPHLLTASLPFFVLILIACGQAPPPISEPKTTGIPATQPSLTATPESPATQIPISSGVPLAAVFAGWYGYDPSSGECPGGVGSTHWNDSPDTAGVIHTPYKGFYCSSDPDIISWQLARMQEAGISVVLYSWWGWGDTDLDGGVEGHVDQYMNTTLTELLNQIQATQSDMKVAVIAEPFTLTQADVPPAELGDRQRRMVLDYLWENYYSVYPDQMFSWQGRPLVVSFDPMMLPEDPRFTIRRWTGRTKGEAGEEWDWSFAPPQDIIEARSDDGVVFVYPRFDEYYLQLGGARYLTWEPRRVDPFLEEGIYERQWRQLVDNRDAISLIILYSWNLYGEQAQIEPSTGGPAPVEDEYVARTRRYYQRFLAGKSIDVDPAKDSPYLKSQNHEYAHAASGDTIVLFHGKGAGVVRQIVIAISGDDKTLVEDETWIKVFVNGQDTPSISAPLSQFFAYTFEADVFSTQRFAVTRKDYNDAANRYERGMYRFQDMPYDTEMRIVLEVGESGTGVWVWSNVYYYEMTTLQGPGRDVLLRGDYFEDLAIPAYSSVDLLDIEGRGRLDSLVLSLEAEDGQQVLEGNLEIYRDGESLPSVYVTGTEDITGNAFYCGTGSVTGPYQGTSVCEAGPPLRSTQYRLFDLDRLDFEKSLRVVWYAGHKGQGEALTNPVKSRATLFYYLDSQPEAAEEAGLELVIEDEFESYGEGQDIGGQWVQREGVAAWRQDGKTAVYDDTGVFDAWMYRKDSAALTDYIVEADVSIGNFGTGEVWLFARGTNDPVFDNRITFGFSAVGAESELPNYTPVMVFAASGSPRGSSLLLIKGSEVNTLRLEVSGELVVMSVKRSVDTEFRELFRFRQSELSSGFAGLSAVTGDVEVEAFRIYRRAW